MLLPRRRDMFALFRCLLTICYAIFDFLFYTPLYADDAAAAAITLMPPVYFDMALSRYYAMMMTRLIDADDVMLYLREAI